MISSRCKSAVSVEINSCGHSYAVLNKVLIKNKTREDEFGLHFYTRLSLVKEKNNKDFVKFEYFY